MIVINGTNGGGQMLRTALGLSAVTGKAFNMINIRASRPKPGLKVQHMECVKAVAKICNAKVENLGLGSTKINFVPRKVNQEKINIKINTAGSVGLVLQAVLVASVKKEIDINIEGGATYGKWAVPTDNLKQVVFKLLEKFGYFIQLRNIKHGFYPKGGAKVKVKTLLSQSLKINLMNKGSLVKVQGVSVAAKGLKNKRVVERQSNKAKEIIMNKLGVVADIKNKYVDSLSLGSGITLWAECQNTIIGSDSLGEIGKKAEDVGKNAAEFLVNNYLGGVVDYFTADQLMVYMGLSGGGEIKTSKITNHIKTNAEIIEKFLSVKFIFEGKRIVCKKV